ncbi:MAG TPA: SDR family oxidoreductase [Actinomycetota bacterium]|jgi:NAD(P)-dependent dehydrogenase (short-subunit alcohol dehydrogenase family)|nr:SDR family oxidoreductase [Actinomycetota bacterium]
MRIRAAVCVVTGASSGIGRAVARDLAARGALLCLVARREDRLRDVLREIGGGDASHSLKVADVADRSQVEELAAFLNDRYGRLDVLVNNAGFSGERPFLGPHAIAEVERVFATNFFGAVNCTGEMLPLLLRSAPSVIVNIASVAGRVALGGSPGYSSSKFALVGWSESLHFTLAPRGISVCSVEPGFIPTEGFPHHSLRRNPLARLVLGTPEEAAEAVAATIEKPRLRVTVPRAYRVAEIAFTLLPPLYRAAGRRRARDRQR